MPYIGSIRPRESEMDLFTMFKGACSAPLMFLQGLKYISGC